METLKTFAKQFITRKGIDELLSWYEAQPNAEKTAQEAANIFNNLYKRLWHEFEKNPEEAENWAIVSLFLNCGKLTGLFAEEDMLEESVSNIRRYIKLSRKEILYILNAKEECELYKTDPFFLEIHTAYILGAV